MITIAEMIKKMIEYPGNTIHDIEHFMKVWGYAKTIGELERLDEEAQFILEASAIVHDIACPLCREKYGDANGKRQEEEGPALVVDFLKDSGMSTAQINRISYLVGHHHTLEGIEGIDYQILIEADYLVNAAEQQYTSENIANFGDRFFKTKAGRSMLDTMFNL